MNTLLGVAWENIFIGLLAATFVGIVSYMRTFLINKLAEKKFPVAGEYLTKFEDENNGVKIESTAPAILKQIGSKINGITYMPEDNRKWIIEGEISNSGHVYGIYYAEDPIDKGIGNFFLKVDNKRNMYGLWSGYDSVNGKITSGKYVFHPFFRDFEIIYITRGYIPQILDISDEELGKDYINYDMLKKITTDADDYICKLAYNPNEAKIVGFCLCMIIVPQDINNIIRIPEDKTPRALIYSERIGVIKTVAVDKKYQGYGIGREIVKDCFNELLQKQVQSMFSIAWKNNEKTNIHGILTGLGFKELIEIPKYWSEDSMKKEYICPVCGQPPCQCSAVIYTQSISGGK